MIRYCASFGMELLTGVHDLSADDIRIALYGAGAGFDETTTIYTAINEVAFGDGYTAGGSSAAMASGYPQLENGFASVRFDIPAVSWTFTARKSISWCLMYNASKANRALMSMYLGGPISAIGPFSITFPLTLPPTFQLKLQG